MKRRTSQLTQTRHRIQPHRQRLNHNKRNNRQTLENRLKAAHLIKMVSSKITATIEDHVKVSLSHAHSLFVTLTLTLATPFHSLSLSPPFSCSLAYTHFYIFNPSRSAPIPPLLLLLLLLLSTHLFRCVLLFFAYFAFFILFAFGVFVIVNIILDFFFFVSFLFFLLRLPLLLDSVCVCV